MGYVILFVLGLIAVRYLGQLLQSGSTAEVGRRLEKDADGVLKETARTTKSCLGIGCLCYIAYCIVVLAGMVVWAIIDTITGW